MKEWVVKISNRFGKGIGNAFSKEARTKINKNLETANMNVSAEKYLSFGILLAFISAVYFGTISFFILNDFVWTIIIVLLSFVLIYVAVKFYPGFEAKRRGKQIEAELPTVLRMVGIQLDINIQFEKIIENLANEDYEVSKEFGIVFREIGSGVSIPLSLQHMTDRVESEIFSRTVNQLVMNYEKGGKGGELKRVANQLAEMQVSELKAFESKMAFTGLIFIAVSCLMPAFFQIFIAIGGILGNVSVSSLHIWIIFVFVFPVISLIALLFINISTPPIATMHKSTFEKDLIIIQRFMKEKKWITITDENDASPVKKLGIKFTIGAGIIAVIFLIGGLMFHDAFYVLFFVSLVSPFVSYFYFLFLAEDRILKMEKKLPEALTHAAMLQKGMSTEQIIGEMSKQKGPLGNEFKIAYRQISAGADVESSLMAIAERNNSLLIKRAVKLIIHGYYAGADMYSALRETAEDIYSLFILISQRKSVLALQKYTLLLGGAILVPLILGSILQVVGSLNTHGLVSVLTDKEITDTADILETIKSATFVYLMIFSIISGIMIAQQEGESKKAIVYAVIIVICAAVLYTLALSSKII
ncbi:type II secretion system F family protein [Candidatus Micrarchaeota archaeon]|nr:type II secretion system F family protein [Candidatus Micrarchaeota archaeon]